MGSAAGGPIGSMPLRPDGAWHEAMPCTSPAELATRLAPRLAAAVDAGEAVVAVLAADVRDPLRELLGGTAGAVDFQDPATVYDVPSFTVAVRWARTSRSITKPDRRLFLVGQQPDLPGRGPEYWARLCIGVDVATAGLPITVLCPFDATSPRAATVRSTHPFLTTDDGPVRSGTYRPPHDALVDYPSPPPPDLGPPAAELLFGAPDLGELRHLVAGVAASGGLGSEQVADVVLAVNELASNSVEHGPGVGRLRIWTGEGLVAEVTDRGRMDVPFPGMALPPPEGARGRGLWLASELSDVLQVWSDDHGTVIRLLVRA